MMEYGTKNRAAAKLTAGQVRLMRQDYAAGATQSALCRKYGVSVGQVGRIVRGESWQDGAGDRMPTPEEMEMTARRLLQVQEETNALGVVAKIDPSRRFKEVKESVSPEVRDALKGFLGEDE